MRAWYVRLSGEIINISPFALRFRVQCNSARSNSSPNASVLKCPQFCLALELNVGPTAVVSARLQRPESKVPICSNLGLTNVTSKDRYASSGLVGLFLMHKARLFEILELGYCRKLPVRGRSTLLDILTMRTASDSGG